MTPNVLVPIVNKVIEFVEYGIETTWQLMCCDVDMALDLTASIFSTLDFTKSKFFVTSFAEVSR